MKLLAYNFGSEHFEIERRGREVQEMLDEVFQLVF
jgi:hypothetical protein